MPEQKQLIQKVDGEVRDKEKVIQWFLDTMDEMPDGCIEQSVKRAKKHKSHKQVKTIFGHMIEQTIIQCNDLGIGIDDLLVYLIDGNIPKGQAITKDFLHQLMYTICPTTDEEGRRVTLSKMNTKQGSELFERFRTTLAPLGIDIPDPNPNYNIQSGE